MRDASIEEWLFRFTLGLVLPSFFPQDISFAANETSPSCLISLVVMWCEWYRYRIENRKKMIQQIDYCGGHT